MRISTNPLWGYGFGNFLVYFPFIPQQQNFNYINEKFTHAHNDLIETPVFELGVIGLISLLLLFINFFREFIVHKKNKELIMIFTCILAYLLNALGNFLSQIAVSGMLLMIFYGMFKGIIKENGKTAESR